jgi:predicted DNA-binding protein with PD1-like motif
MSSDAHRSDKARHLVLRLGAGEDLSGALIERLQEEGVVAGWLRASGVLADVGLRAYDVRIGGLAASRLIAGPVQALSLEGAIGSSDGVPSCGLRAVLAREGDAGLEMLGGEIESARVVALEALVTALDDVALARSFDEQAGVWLVGEPGARRAGAGPRAQAPGAQSAWSGALAASAEPERERVARATQAGAGTPTGTARIPQRPARQPIDFDSPVPDAGDVVEHFAFGRCDVLKSDGDRLFLKVYKDGRIREIALEMLRVSRLDDGSDSAGVGEAGGRSRFKLDRKM